jgi:putative sterol carrier protein
MDATWANKVCKAWNQNNILVSKLGGSWVKNNAGRGYKIIQIYRDKCGESSKIQLLIKDKGGKAICIKGGKPDGKKVNSDVDYVMHASDKDWICIGKGSFGCGAMGAMTTGKLKFNGPKMEAMSVMGPFGDFLTLTGKVPGDKNSCK